MPLPTKQPVRVEIRSASIDVEHLERRVIRKLVARLLQTKQLQYRYVAGDRHCLWLPMEQQPNMLVQSRSMLEALTLFEEQLLQQQALHLSTQVDDQETKITAEWCG